MKEAAVEVDFSEVCGRASVKRERERETEKTGDSAEQGEKRMKHNYGGL